MAPKSKTVRTVPLAILVALFAMQLGPSPARADRPEHIYNVKWDVDQSYWYPCLGETIHWTGLIQWTEHIIFDSLGGYHQTINWHSAITGTSDSGIKFESHWSRNWVDNDSRPRAYETTYAMDRKIVGQGSGVVLFEHQTLHWTFNANGTETAELDNVSFECR